MTRSDAFDRLEKDPSRILARGTHTLKQHKLSLGKRYGHVLFGLALLVSIALTGCNRGRTTETKVSGPEAAVQTTNYQGDGVVKRTDAKRPSIEIDHGEIKGLMPAMTMEFYVRDKSLLEGLKPGDHIQFTLENGVGGLKITSITRL